MWEMTFFSLGYAVPNTESIVLMVSSPASLLADPLESGSKNRMDKK